MNFRVGYRLPGYEGLDSPKLGSSPKFPGSPKYSEETVTCDSDGKTGNEDYIRGNQIEIYLADSLTESRSNEINLYFIVKKSFLEVEIIP